MQRRYLMMRHCLLMALVMLKAAGLQVSLIVLRESSAHEGSDLTYGLDTESMER